MGDWSDAAEVTNGQEGQGVVTIDRRLVGTWAGERWIRNALDQSAAAGSAAEGSVRATCCYSVSWRRGALAPDDPDV